MKKLVYPLLFLLSLSAFSQQIHDEFMPTIIGDKEAFLSSKTGEFVYREHDKTDVSAMYTSDSGTVIYEDRKVHSVKKGETLSAIAKKRGVSISDLKTQNKLKSNSLSIGQELKVVKKLVVNSSKPVINKPEGKIIARLAPGQTPGGMTPPDLPPDAMPGSTINLVVDGDAKPPTNQPVKTVTKETSQVAVNDINEDGTLNHVVKSGETLFSIARKYKVSIADLKKENKLALNTVSAGQKLKVKVYNPAVFSQNNSVTTETVVEEKPEIIEVVEEVTEQVELVVTPLDKKGKPVTEKKFNAVISSTSTPLSTGSVEKSQTNKDKALEDANEERTKALIEKYKNKETSVTSSGVEKSPSEGKVYIVKKGDTLWSIAKRNQISLKDLKELNKLETNVLSVGQELKVK